VGSKLFNLVGQKFGRLTVIELDHREKRKNARGYRTYWKCICDCGSNKIIISSSQCLLQGNTQSCGCLRIESNRRGKTSDDILVHKLYGNYYQSAKFRNFEFLLTEEEFRKLLKGDCFYCNKEPNQIITNKCTQDTYLYNGIDRIDPMKGYTSDNTVACCWMCNFKKNDTPFDEFMDWIKTLYNNMVSKGLIIP
jgi:hypothetical protein